MIQPLRLGLRWIVRRPLVSLTSAGCLSLGVAACAIAWTLLDATIFRPFGLPKSDQLVIIWETDPARQQDLIEVSQLNFLDWQRQSRTLASLASFGSQHWPALARIGSETVPLATRGVSTSFFATLGVRPAIGRDFVPDDAGPGVLPPAMLSHRLWRSRFAGAPSVVGQRLFIDGTDHHIVGVMPAGFAYPDDPDVWVSVERVLGDAFQKVPLDQQRAVGVLEVLGRRKPETSNREVRDELTGVIQGLRRRHQPAGGDITVAASVTPFADVLLGRLGSRLWIALAMAAAVFLFACANVAAVRMAQARERASELAARLFLGATRRRMATDLAVESAPVVFLAGLLSSALWLVIVTTLSRATAIAESGVDLAAAQPTAIVVTIVLSLVTWLLVGVLPAIVASRHSVVEARRAGTRIQRTSRIGAPLLFGQAAAAVAVVALAAAAWQAFDRLSRIDLGFQTSGVTLVDINLPGWKYETPAAGRAVVERLRVALAELPAVRRVAAVSVRPFRFGEIADGLPVRRGGDELVQPDDATAASRVVVTPDYFAAIGQPIVDGRGFSDFDRVDTETVVVISRTLARTLFGDGPAVGRRLDTFTMSEKWRSRLIIGVAGDAQYRGLERPSMEVYVPHLQSANPLGSFVVAFAPTATISDATIRQTLQKIEPEIAIERIQTTGELAASVLSPARLLMMVMSLLGGTGWLLVALGIFGAAATALRAALPEIAVRQAIGARPLQAARAPLRGLTRALLFGVALGLLLTPLVLSGAATFGFGVSGAFASPVAAATLMILVAATVAIGPLLWSASRHTPAELLRDH